jgi:alpha-glucoside transport system substrate-binding protein
MDSRFSSRRLGAVGATLCVASLALAACGSSSSEVTPQASVKPGCEAYAQYGDLSGKSVSVYTSIVAPESQQQIDSYKPFEDCTGATINYEGSKEFEAQLLVRLQGGNAPDIAYIPQPGLLNTIVQRFPDSIQEAPQGVSDNVDKWFSPDWRNYGSVDGTLYAAPLGANVKSFVWYSPKFFADHGYTVPTTWDEMMTLTEKIAADGVTPWCAGFGSGDATGWPGTDWVEDVMLRTAGGETYDKWVNHEIPFNDPSVVKAFDTVGKILKDPNYVNGGFGDVKTIASTTFQDGGLPILKDKCAMHRQAGFYAANWPEGTKVAEDGDVFAFYLPPIDPAQGKPVLGGGEFVGAFSDRPEVQAFQAYLASPEWANAKAKATPAGGWISANKGLDPANLVSPIDKLSVGLLTDPNVVFRFDGSDLMPAAVGAGSFWKGMTAWITGQSTQETVDNIESSWPS